MAGSDRMVSRTGGDRDKALETALAQIERQFGRGSVMRLGDESRAPMEVIPTGAIALDVALGIGGLPRGRVVEIYGPEGSGKTTLALQAVANAQRAGGIAAFVDAEHALDPEYAKNLGVDTDALLVSQPDTGEQALEIADMLIRSGAIDVVVIDSVAALVPRAEIEGEMGDSHVGLQARLMSQALRKLAGALNQTKTTAIFINQLREKVGVMFGSPRPPAVGGRSSSMLRYGWMCAGSKRLKTAPRQSAAGPGLRSSRISAPRHSKSRNATFSSALGLAGKAGSSTSGSSSRSCASPVPGTPTRATSSGRARRTPGIS